MFDVDSDGSLGGKELAAFFSAFQGDTGTKVITADDFVAQGLRMLALEEEREAELEQIADRVVRRTRSPYIAPRSELPERPRPRPLT